MPIHHTSDKKVLLSGIKSTGRPHIGNYFGVMKQYLELQHQGYDSRIFIADFHSLTTVHDADTLAQSTLDLAIDYLAIGLDPNLVTIFKQSDVPELTELTWIFNAITTMPYLMRAHAFKDAEAKNKDINVALFDYPLLMAADILIQNSDIVPVGRDQKQHVEIARDTAEKFNRIFCKTETLGEDAGIFKLPEPYIVSAVETVPGIDGQKMSKSYNNHIPLFSEDDDIRKLVMSIVTDSGASAGGVATTSGADIEASDTDASATDSMAGIPLNVFNIHKLFIGNSDLISAGKAYLKSEESLKEFYRSTEGKYKPLKDALAEDLIAFITPLRARRALIAQDTDAIRNMLAKNGAAIREKVHPLVYEVRRKVGLIV
ncbi:MAG: tryptophan--tRNA ligase [Candidatus Pacebacteria bacterium]|nr:tryptophan--tRNA ligase [Candidatus Paceibacterota bacterium]